MKGWTLNSLSEVGEGPLVDMDVEVEVGETGFKFKLPFIFVVMALGKSQIDESNWVDLKERGVGSNRVISGVPTVPIEAEGMVPIETVGMSPIGTLGCPNPMVDW